MEESLSKIPQELEYIWKGKKESAPSIYRPIAKKTKGSFVGSLYEKTSNTEAKPDKPKSRWLGKLGMPDNSLTSANTLSISKMRRGTNRDAVKEKFASDFYYLLACESNFAFDVPKARLADLPIINEFTAKNDLARAIVEQINRSYPDERVVTNAIHVMSKWVKDYHDLSEAQVRNKEDKIVPYLTHFKETGCFSETIIVKGKEIPLEGLLELLAASRLLGDVDVLGNGGSNAGFVVNKNVQGIPIFAKIVKVDPGFAFTVDGHLSLLVATLYPPSNPIEHQELRRLEDTKDIQFGTNIDVLHWSLLTDNQRNSFLSMLKKGMDLLKQKDIVHEKFWRKELFNKYGDHLLITEEMIKKYLNCIAVLLEMQEKAYGNLISEFQQVEKEQMSQQQMHKAMELSRKLQLTQQELDQKNEMLAVKWSEIEKLEKDLTDSKKREAGLKMEFDAYRTTNPFPPLFFPPALSTKQQEKQDQLVAACLKGNLALVWQLELPAASLMYPNREGIYPLVAAVYGCHLETVKYVESKLKDDEAAKQWSKVDVRKVQENLNRNMPTELSMNVTYGYVGDWYIKNAGKSWCAYYDAECLRQLKHPYWGGWDNKYMDCRWVNMSDRWGMNNKRSAWAFEKGYYSRRSKKMTEEEGIVLDAGADIHGEVMKQIREQLEALRKELDTKLVNKGVSPEQSGQKYSYNS